MASWDWSASIGIILGVGAFAATFFLIIAAQYREYGRFVALRLLGAAAVSIYATTLVAYTLLPLPTSRDDVCTPALQLIPFHFVSDIRVDTAGDSVLAVLTSTSTLQVVFNIFLFVPFGVIVRGFFGRGLLATVLSGVVVSVLIEATQYTGIWGLYSCPYRVADIDDVLTNTLGALVGGLIGLRVLAWMPKERALRASRGEPRRVTVWRRWLGMAIDFALYSAVGTVLSIGYRLVLVAVTDGPVSRDPDAVEVALTTLVPALLVFVLPAARRTGASLGQTAVWLMPRWPRPVTRARRMLRAASVGGLYGVLAFLSQLDLPVAAAAGTAGALLLVAAATAVPFTRDRAGLSGLVAGSVMRDERQVARGADAEPTRS